MVLDDDILPVLLELAEAPDRSAWLDEHPEARDRLRFFIREMGKDFADEPDRGA